ncbi:hypothetical protein EDB87DRAFT_1582521 [Lactarius vividus]|nr:hypothetical protein EDB87DRAFT_1582521 [Lactarius vividus]
MAFTTREQWRNFRPYSLDTRGERSVPRQFLGAAKWREYRGDTGYFVDFPGDATIGGTLSDQPEDTIAAISIQENFMEKTGDRLTETAAAKMKRNNRESKPPWNQATKSP